MEESFITIKYSKQDYLYLFIDSANPCFEKLFCLVYKYGKFRPDEEPKNWNNYLDSKIFQTTVRLQAHEKLILANTLYQLHNADSFAYVISDNPKVHIHWREAKILARKFISKGEVVNEVISPRKSLL